MSSIKLVFKTHIFLATKFIGYTLSTLFLLILLFFSSKLADTTTLFVIFSIFAFLVWFGMSFLCYHYFFYVLDFAHAAVIVSFLEGNQVPKSQVSYGIKMVNQSIQGRRMFFYFRKLLTSALKEMSGLPRFLIFFLFLDYAVLSNIFFNGVWKGLRDGAVLFYKSKKVLLKKAVQGVILNYFLSFIFFLVFYLYLAPLVPGIFGEIPFLFSLIVVFYLKFSFLNPFTFICGVVSFYRLKKMQTVDSLTLRKLELNHPAFEEILKHTGDDMQEDPAVAQLLPYVEQYRSLGWSDDQIIQSLTQKGWQRISVLAALQRN